MKRKVVKKRSNHSRNAIYIILAASIIGAIWVVKQAKIISNQDSFKIVANSQPQKAKAQSFGIVSLTGTIASLEKDAIKIKNGETTNSFAINDQIKILLVDGKILNEGKIDDMKAGQKVSLMINQSTSTIQVIQILQSGDQFAY